MAALVALAIALTAVVVAVVVMPGGESRCGVPPEVVLWVSTDTVDVMRTLAEDFSTEGDGCRKANIQVVSTSSASEIRDALARGWTKEDLRRVGPYPHVWIPSSSLEVDWVRQAMPENSPINLDTRLDAVMSSYLVLAVPGSLHGQPGWDKPIGLSLQEVVDRAENSGSRLRINRETPETSTEGWVSTTALYRTELGDSFAGHIRNLLNPELPDDVEAGVLRPLRQMEQATETTADTRDPGRELGCRAALSVSPRFEVALMSEQRVYTHNVDPLAPGRLPGASCGANEARPLTAFYPTDGAPLLDYPFVVIDSPRWTNSDRTDVVENFHDFLQDDRNDHNVQDTLAEYGFRPPGGVAMKRPPPAAAGIMHGDPRSGDEPVVTATQISPVQLTEAWQKARKRARVLFAVDVSGSMETVGSDGNTPLAAAVEATDSALRLISGDDQIGLWKFSTKLNGAEDHLELVPLGQADDGFETGSRRSLVQRELNDLGIEAGDTGLFDTIRAGVIKLRADARTDKPDEEKTNAVVVFTDGHNDDPGGINADEVVTELNKDATGERRVLVTVLAFGEGNCMDVERQLGGRVQCEEVTSSSVRAVLERVGAGLWGIGKQ